MSFTIEIFRDLIFIVFFLYIFFETRVYLAIWVSLFHLLHMLIKSLSFNITIYKGVIVLYILIVLCAYLYLFRNVLLGKEKPVSNKKLSSLSTDKAKQRRVGISILLLLIVNVAAVFIFRRN